MPEAKGPNIWIFNESKDKNIWPNAMRRAFTSVSNHLGSSVCSEVSGTQLPGPSLNHFCIGQPRKTTLLVTDRWKAETLCGKTQIPLDSNASGDRRLTQSCISGTQMLPADFQKAWTCSSAQLNVLLLN